MFLFLFFHQVHHFPTQHQARIAKFLQISSVSVSHIFNGPRDLSIEQALELCEFFNLNEMEADYFFLLVQIERAGTVKLKNKFRKELEIVKGKFQNLKSRVKQDRQLNENAKAIFYSNWYYSAIRMASSIEGNNSIDKISHYLQLPMPIVRDALEFLLQHGLCIENNKGSTMGPASTHLESTSILINRHHANWRLKGIEKMIPITSQELFYSGPMALSEETMNDVRKMLVDVIDNIVNAVIPSPSETVACLNIDWFKLKK